MCNKLAMERREYAPQGNSTGSKIITFSDKNITISLAVRRKFFFLLLLTLILMFDFVNRQPNSELVENQSLPELPAEKSVSKCN